MTKTRDLVSGLALVILSAVLFWQTMGGGIILFEDDIDPMLYPRVLTVMLGSIGIILCIRALLQKSWPPNKDIRIFTARTVSVAIVLILYAILFNVLGYLVSSMFAGCGVAWMMGWRKPVSLVLVNAIAVVCIWLLFVKGLRIVLPSGTIFNYF